MSKESITIDDLTNILSEVKKEQMELIQSNPDMFPSIILHNRYLGKLEMLMYMFHFLGLGTKQELEKVKEKAIEEMKKEIGRIKEC